MCHQNSYQMLQHLLLKDIDTLIKTIDFLSIIKNYIQQHEKYNANKNKINWWISHNYTFLNPDNDSEY